MGTSADTRAGVQADYDFFRLYQTAYYQLRPGLFAGAGLYFDNHTNVGPTEGVEAEWAESPYVRYSEEHGLPLDAQISAGPSLDLLWDTRDSFINRRSRMAREGQLRTLFDGFLGGDSSWQKLNLDVRTYANVSRDRRHKLAVLGVRRSRRRGSGAVSSTCPRPASDTYGRSAADTAKGSSAVRSSRTARSSIARR